MLVVGGMKRVEVAAAVLRDAGGRVLLAQRPEDVHQGGLWEFPGGKREAGESLEETLRRELAEEIGIEVLTHRRLIRVSHDYGERHVELDVHLVEDWRGEPTGREGQPLAWVDPGDLAEYPLPAADRPILTALQLPTSYWITPPDGSDTERFLARLAEGLERGARLVQFRVFGAGPAETLRLGQAAAALCREAGARLLVNDDLALAEQIGADGLHVSGRQLPQFQARYGASSWVPGLIAASCHQPAELRLAERLGVDFVVLSPVLPTPSHPDAEPLGWERFGDWVASTNLPVYALGGMRPDLIELAWAHGGQGIAGIRGLWP